MLRRTKIVATLGPATDDPKALDDLIQSGVDVCRINFSHGVKDEHLQRAETVRNRARAHGRQVGIIADLQGPKIRIECFKNGPVMLKEGDLFTLDAALGKDAGDENRVGITYKGLPDDVTRGDTLLLDDGAIVLWVDDVEGAEINCRIVVGGQLSDHKGINKQGGGLSAGALTEKDHADIQIAAEMGADYLALSFPQNAADVNNARELLHKAGGHGNIIAKIERAEALDNIEEIIEASDAIMIARGDLGVEIGDPELPGVQKEIISKARAMNRVVITATQMMQSMITSHSPTRAEVMDVANAVLDGTDAVMLSAETSVGKHPAKVVSAMSKICQGAELHREATISTHRMECTFDKVDEAIAMAAMYTANHLGVAAIVCLTESGSTPLWMSRISSGIPIYAMTSRVNTRRKVTLYRGVYPVSFKTDYTDHALVNKEAVDDLVRRGAVRDGDLVIITKGDLAGKSGGTNAMKIVKVGDMYIPTYCKVDT
jgi:pyruvate kinase